MNDSLRKRLDGIERELGRRRLPRPTAAEKHAAIDWEQFERDLMDFAAGRPLRRVDYPRQRDSTTEAGHADGE